MKEKHCKCQENECYCIFIVFAIIQSSYRSVVINSRIAYDRKPSFVYCMRFFVRLCKNFEQFALLSKVIASPCRLNLVLERKIKYERENTRREEKRGSKRTRKHNLQCLMHPFAMQ